MFLSLTLVKDLPSANGKRGILVEDTVIRWLRGKTESLLFSVGGASSYFLLLVSVVSQLALKKTIFLVMVCF